MLQIKYFLICSAFLFLQACSAYSFCSERKGNNGSISDFFIVDGVVQYSKCWKVLNPAKNIIHFRLNELHLDTQPQSAGNLTIFLEDDKKIFTFWSFSSSGNITTSSTSVEVRFEVKSGYFPNNYKTNFTLQYEMVVVADVRSKAITWLKNQRSPLLDRRGNTLRALTALYLAGNTTYDGTDVREELITRRAEFLISRALQRTTVSEIDLSYYINFLRVTCNSLRHFASYDFMQHLRNQLESTSNFTHPSVYLALCNANEKWPQKAVSDLTNILNSRSEYVFLKDIQAFALIAISCKMNQTNSLTSSERSSLLPIYRTSVANLKRKQFRDGSFGDIYDSALAIQTLISADGELPYNWDSNAAIRYVTKQLNSSELDFQAVYLSLPLLNWKSMSDISKINCTGHPRNKDIITEAASGSKIEVPNDHVRYSLFIGDKKELIRTITFRIPSSFTAYQVMMMAEVQDVKFKFQRKIVSNRIHVDEISQIRNDPENGKFWLLYLGSNDKKSLVPYFNEGPQDIFVRPGDHLIMWYKTAEI